MEYLFIIGIVLARIWVRFKYPLAINIDSAMHLVYAKGIRENGHRFLDWDYRLRPYFFVYPFAYHWLMSLLSPRMMRIAEEISSPLFDGLAALCVLMAAKWCVAVSPVTVYEHLPLACTILFIFSPALTSNANGPRAYSGTPRVMGELLYMLHMLLSVLFLSSGSLAALAGAVLAGSVLIITSKFSNQVLVFFAPFVVYFGSGWYLAIVGASFLGSFLLFRKHSVNVLRSQINLSICYATFMVNAIHGLKTRTFRQYLTSWKEHGLVKIRNRKPINFMYWLIEEEYLFHSLLVCFTPFVISLGSSFNFLPGHGGGMLRGWYYAALVCCCITSTKYFLFLGESRRYLEYAMLPVILATAVLLGAHPFVLWAVTCATAILGIVGIVRISIHAEAAQARTKNHYDAIEVLNSLPDGKVLPFGHLEPHCLLWANKPVIGFNYTRQQKPISNEEYQILFANWHYPSCDYEYIFSRYEPTYLLAQHWAFQKYIECVGDSRAFLKTLETVYENDGVRLMRVVGQNQEHPSDQGEELSRQ